MIDTDLEAQINEMKKAIEKWWQSIGEKDAASIVNRTSLQVGIHDSVVLEYADERAMIGDAYLDDLDFERDARGSNHPSTGSIPEESIRGIVVPKLAFFMQEKLDNLPQAALIDYSFSFWGKFQTENGKINMLILKQIDQAKKEQLLERVQAYLERLEAQPASATDPLETFFLARHLLDRDLFPKLDTRKIISTFEQILDLNKGNQPQLREHRHTIVHALRDWAEHDWLLQHFERKELQWGQKVYTKKAEQHLGSIDQGEMELFLYTAVAILKYEPSYARDTGSEFLERAKELGSELAAQILLEGSGSIAREDRQMANEVVECKANDVFATVTITVKQEGEECYAQAIRFLCQLLRAGFPKSYQIKLTSKEKQFLPIKGMAKSATHRFFANALAYPSLHPLLEEYAREAICEYEWYTDTEGEKNCMPGTYAVFGLGLADERYFPLVEHYMKQVDEEHQSVQNYFTAAFVDKHGVNAKTIPTLTICLLHGTDSMKPKLKEQVEEEANLAVLLESIRLCESYQVEHLVYIVWGGVAKLKSTAAKAKGEKADMLKHLVEEAAGVKKKQANES
ncbi:DUF6138 family protein [Brevibacillus centrosporus]|uniref:DUF6138 family protein n=1 Tax=Brevibacillus centrosporus TaxID=54910 RepID=UPI0038086E89